MAGFGLRFRGYCAHGREDALEGATQETVGTVVILQRQDRDWPKQWGRKANTQETFLGGTICRQGKRRINK